MQLTRLAMLLLLLATLPALLQAMPVLLQPTLQPLQVPRLRMLATLLQPQLATQPPTLALQCRLLAKK